MKAKKLVYLSGGSFANRSAHSSLIEYLINEEMNDVCCIIRISKLDMSKRTSVLHNIIKATKYYYSKYSNHYEVEFAEEEDDYMKAYIQ